MIDQLMFDCETLGTSSDSVIMSIGAVKFDLKSNEIDDDGFYASISIDSNLESRRTISEDTLIWWMGQDKAAQGVFIEAKMTLEDALTSFADWIGAKRLHPWSNGADFDIPMVAHAFKSFGMDTPWNFYDSRCVRTYKSLEGAKDIKVVNAAKHNALSDAIAQVRLVQAINARLFKARV